MGLLLAFFSIITELAGFRVELAYEIVKPLKYVDIFVICSFVAVSEELFFRAFILEEMRKAGTAVALIFSSILFAFFHISYHSFTETAGAFLMGVLLGELYIKKGVFPATVAHFISNTISMTFMKIAM